MVQPSLGQEEHAAEARAVLSGERAEQTDLSNPISNVASVVCCLDSEVFSRDQSMTVDVFRGYRIAVRVNPKDLRHNLLLTADRQFKYIVEDPLKYDVPYLLVTSNEVAQDAITWSVPGSGRARNQGSNRSRITRHRTPVATLQGHSS